MERELVLALGSAGGTAEHQGPWETNVYNCLGEKARKEAENKLFDSGENSRKKYGGEATMRSDDNEGEKGEQCWRRESLGGGGSPEAAQQGWRPM